MAINGVVFIFIPCIHNSMDIIIDYTSEQLHYVERINVGGGGGETLVR